MNYFYEAVDESGQTVLGKMDAVDAQEAQRKLLQMGYRPQSIAPNTPSAANAPAPHELTLMNGATGLSVPPRPAGISTLDTPAQSASVSTLGSAAKNINRTGSVTFSGNAARLASKTGMRKAARPLASPPLTAEAKLGGVSTRDLMFFFQQMTSLTRSGINLYSALQDLSTRTRNRNLAKTLGEMAEQARTGGRISDVMEKYPRIYPEHIVGTVRAGELGGFLDIAMSEIALNYEQNIALYRGAWIPKLMASQAFFTLVLVLPLFGSIFASMDFQANILSYIRQEVFFYIPGGLALYFGAKFAARRLQLPQFRRLRDSWSLKMPPFGDLQRQASISAFVRMLRKLYHAGISPIHAWEGAMNTASNVVIRDRLADAYDLMQSGSSLPDAFTATGLFTNQVENLIITGHQSGEVVESLDKAADFYQERVDEAAGKSRFMMLRLGFLAMLIFGGAAMLWMVHTYFQGIFHFVDANFGTDGFIPFPLGPG